jgi:hypothetical protein
MGGSTIGRLGSSALGVSSEEDGFDAGTLALFDAELEALGEVLEEHEAKRPVQSASASRMGNARFKKYFIIFTFLFLFTCVF